MNLTKRQKKAIKNFLIDTAVGLAGGLMFGIFIHGALAGWF